jgi:hypothetical protein
MNADIYNRRPRSSVLLQVVTVLFPYEGPGSSCSPWLGSIYKFVTTREKGETGDTKRSKSIDTKEWKWKEWMVTMAKKGRKCRRLLRSKDYYPVSPTAGATVSFPSG